MKSAARAIFGITLAGILSSAFGGAAADLPQNPSANNAPIPKRGGTLHLASIFNVNSLDPAGTTNGLSMQALILLYDGLSLVEIRANRVLLIDGCLQRPGSSPRKTLTELLKMQAEAGLAELLTDHGVRVHTRRRVAAVIDLRHDLVAEMSDLIV